MSRNENNYDKGISWWTVLKVVLYFGLAIALFTIAYPFYNVFELRMKGTAEYYKSTQDRQIMVQEALAKAEAAMSEAEAITTLAGATAKKLEIEAKGQAQKIITEAEAQAKAVILKAKAEAEAISTVRTPLGDIPTYLKYQWIHALDKSNTIYLPFNNVTEIPILEAGKRPEAQP
jgi:regulator of protease activity HflC (stomatin/prohibitin superfamily)